MSLRSSVRPLTAAVALFISACSPLLGAGCSRVVDPAVVDELRSGRLRGRDTLVLPGGAAPISELEPELEPEFEPDPEPRACTSDDQCDRLICDCVDQPQLAIELCFEGRCAEASTCGDVCPGGVPASGDLSAAIDDLTSDEVCSQLYSGVDSCADCLDALCCPEIVDLVTAPDLPLYDECSEFCASYDRSCFEACGAANAFDVLDAYYDCSFARCTTQCDW